MKYFAILKDSLREALDSTVLYVMIGLSTLVILFVATLSFRPLPAEKTMQSLVDGTLSVMLDLHRPERQSKERLKKRERPEGFFKLDKVDVLNGEPDSPDSEYRLTVSLHLPGREKTDETLADPTAALAQLKEHFALVEDVGLIRIGAVRLAREAQNPDESKVTFLVDTQPTAGTRRIWFSEPSLFFGSIPLTDIQGPLGFQLFFITRLVIYFGSWIAILTGVVITSFFIPNMLRKGTIDLLLVKPISRWQLLLYKYLGGLTFIFINNAYAIVGIWLVLGLRTGVWANYSLLLIFALTFVFGILYSISTLFGVLTRSTVTAILMTIGCWFIFFLVGSVHSLFEMNKRIEQSKPQEQRTWTNNPVGKVVGGLHAVLPRTAELDQLSEMLIFSDFLTGSLREVRKLDPSNRSWQESVLVSGIFIVILLTLACWRFSTKDY